ncbi:MAG: penicillin-binding protein 1C, partial [Acidobacteria bacterium]
GAEPNLSVILGGAGTTLEDLVGAYSALARKGLSATPRFLPDAPLQERRMMSEGAAFMVRDILETGGPVGRVVEGRGPYRGFAWKTGTSFGFRDAWAAGVSDRYTIGVWVGRPDGTPNPGFFGANVAAKKPGFGVPSGRQIQARNRYPGGHLLACWYPRRRHGSECVSRPAHCMAAGRRSAADVSGSLQKRIADI